MNSFPRHYINDSRSTGDMFIYLDIVCNTVIRCCRDVDTETSIESAHATIDEKLD
jgi:hypothetical protein